MTYKQLPPPDYLKDYVRHFWVLESQATDTLSASFRTIVDGCPGFIFQAQDKGVLYQNNKALPGIILYGQATSHAEIRIKGTFCTTGIHFYPHALKSIFGLNADELTDTCMNLDILTGEQGFQLSAQLSETASFGEQIAIISAYLLSQIQQHKRYDDKAIQYAISCIKQTKGNISVKELRTVLQVSERNFERRFKQQVGISPKLFTRISRFQASLHLLRNSEYEKLSDIAFLNEYADQSHFIRAFREFAGCSPFQYQKTSREVMDNLSVLAK